MTDRYLGMVRDAACASDCLTVITVDGELTLESYEAAPDQIAGCAAILLDRQGVVRLRDILTAWLEE